MNFLKKIIAVFCCLFLATVGAFAQTTFIVDGIFYETIDEQHVMVIRPNDIRYYGNVVIPENVTNEDNTYIVSEIGRYAFKSSNSVSSISLPKTLKTIGDAAFQYCATLKSITLPASLENIGAHSFSNCTGLTKIVIPDSVEVIEYSAFDHCSSLSSIVIGKSVTLIKESAFAHCAALTSLKIPENVKEIQRKAFNHCRKLANITFGGKNTKYDNNSFAATPYGDAHDKDLQNIKRKRGIKSKQSKTVSY